MGLQDYIMYPRTRQAYKRYPSMNSCFKYFLCGTFRRVFRMLLTTPTGHFRSVGEFLCGNKTWHDSVVFILPTYNYTFVRFLALV